MPAWRRAPPFSTRRRQQYEKVLDINLKSAFFGTQLAAQQMIKQGGGGRIINITSVHEDWPMPGNTAYCLSKGGMRMLTRTAGVELAPHNILVVGVGPGAVATPINLSTMQDPDAAAKTEQRHSAGPHGQAGGNRQRGGVSGRGRRELHDGDDRSLPMAASCRAARGCRRRYSHPAMA